MTLSRKKNILIALYLECCGYRQKGDLFKRLKDFM